MYYPTERGYVGALRDTWNKPEANGSHEDVRRTLFGQTHPTHVESDVGSANDGNSLEDSE